MGRCQIPIVKTRGITAQLDNSDTSPAEEELQQYENMDQETTEESLIAADIKESFTDNEATLITELTDQDIISYVKVFNDYVADILRSHSYYSTKQDLQKEWSGNIFLHPPIEIIDSFTEKLNNDNVSKVLFMIPSNYDKPFFNDIKSMSIFEGVLDILFENEYYRLLLFFNEDNDISNTSSD